MITDLEVLSPAGSFDAVVAAVRAGADAVYFGAPLFNARRNAKNFSREELKLAAEFCLIRGVKTYLTLNTLISDDERKDALETAKFAWECGINALIIQDLGLARLIKRHFPFMPIHASTQLSVHSLEALESLKEIGFERVVVAREMDKEALKRFCKRAKELNIEVEAFVHGALCMCLSGQCYLSSVLGGRSGNRGLCAQPCRLEFSDNGKEGHLLSLKDMSLIDYIAELKEMGICSLKIEGRMKRAEYVAAATAVCRAAVLNEPISEELKQLLSGIFSRNGHTDGYYKNALGKDMFGYRTSDDEKLSQSLINSAHELYRRERQSVAVSAFLKVQKGIGAELTFSDNNGNSVAVSGLKPEAAMNVPLNESFAKEKLSKLGGSPYFIENFSCKIDENLSLAGSELNRLRAEAVKALSAKRAEVTKPETPLDYCFAKQNKSGKKGIKTVARFRCYEQMSKDLSGVSAVILPLKTDFSALSIGKDIPVIVEIPRGIMHSIDFVKERLAFAAQNGIKAALCNNIAAFSLAKEAGLSIVAGFGMNVYNSDANYYIEELGASASVLSFELSVNEAEKIGGNIPRGIISYGRLPLMLMRNCPIKSIDDKCKNCGGKAKLTDRKGVEFPIICEGEFTELYNSKYLWMFDRKQEYSALDFEVLWFTDESCERASEVINAALAKEKPDCDFTRGLYYREVK